MKIIGFFLILLIWAHASAWAAGEIIEISNGNCWLQEPDIGVLKVSSFGDGVSHQITGQDLSEFISEVNLRYPDNRFETLDTYIHCGSYGMRVVLNVKASEFPLCLWGKVENGRLKLSEVNATDGSGGFCHGRVPGSLIIKARDLFHVIRGLSELSDLVEDASPFMNEYVKVTLKDSYYFREVEGMEIIREYFKTSDVLIYVEPNGRVHPVGDSYKVESFSN